MLTSKIFEIRDVATRIDVMATKMKSDYPVTGYYLERNGYDTSSPLVILTRLDEVKSTYDPFSHTSSTMELAHNYISENFDTIPNNWVVDIETLQGYKTSMKIPERYKKDSDIDLFIKQDFLNSIEEVVTQINKNYGLNSARSIGCHVISFSYEEVTNFGIKFYDVLNKYFDMD